MKETLFKMFAGMLEQVGESKLEEVLQQLHDSDETRYNQAVVGGWALVSALEPLVEKTKTSIDDMLVNGIKDAISASAKTNDVELPVF